MKLADDGVVHPAGVLELIGPLALIGKVSLGIFKLGLQHVDFIQMAGDLAITFILDPILFFPQALDVFNHQQERVAASCHLLASTGRSGTRRWFPLFLNALETNFDPSSFRSALLQVQSENIELAVTILSQV